VTATRAEGCAEEQLSFASDAARDTWALTANGGAPLAAANAGTWVTVTGAPGHVSFWTGAAWQNAAGALTSPVQVGPTAGSHTVITDGVVKVFDSAAISRGVLGSSNVGFKLLNAAGDSIAEINGQTGLRSVQGGSTVAPAGVGVTAPAVDRPLVGVQAGLGNTSILVPNALVVATDVVRPVVFNAPPGGALVETALALAGAFKLVLNAPALGTESWSVEIVRPLP
jgi:hypothetical protein